MSRICVVHQNDGTDVRVGKVCRTLSKQHDVIFLGWARDSTASVIDLGNSSAIIFKKDASYGARSIGTKIRFVLWVLVKIFSLRPATVIAVNEELAFPLLIVKPFLCFKLIIDIHDPLADRVRQGSLQWFIYFVQSVARYWANLLWVTDENRFQRLGDPHRRKAKIVPNFPNRPDFDVLQVNKSISDDELRVAVIGSLHENRGVNILRAAVEKVGDIRIELAGWYTDSESRQLGSESYAHYNGILGMQASLHLIASCDLVFCFYNPESINNRNASPNKIYEAICMGKRSIINSETKVADWVVTNNFGYACAYNDVAALSDILKFAKENISLHRIPNEVFLEFAKDRFYWETCDNILLESVVDQRDIVFVISYLPLGRMLRRVKTASSVGHSAIICWDRIVQDRIENKIHESIEQIKIAQKSIEGSPLSTLSSMPLFTAKALSNLRRLKPKIIHTELLNMLFIAVVYKYLFSNRVSIIYEVSDLHNMIIEQQNTVFKRIINRLLNKFEKFMCRYVQLLIVTSPYFYDEYYASFLSAEKVMFIPNTPEEGILHGFKRKSTGKFTVGFIGYVRYKKQLEMLIRVSEICDVNVLIAGVGPDYQDLYNRYKNNSNVSFYGRYEYEKEIRRLYEMVDCVYSVYDTSLKNVRIALPNKLYESITCNLPIIVAKNTKLAKFVAEWGVGVEVSDTMDYELEAAILKLKNDKGYFNEISSNCLKAVEKISCKKINEDYVSILKKSII